MIRYLKVFSTVTLLLLLLMGGLFFWKGIISVDPDFGWHLQSGELILHTGWPKTDPFSYTLSNYHYIDFEWLSDVIIALLYNNLGIPAVALLYGLIAIGSLVLLIPKRFWAYAWPLLLLVTPTLLSGSGIRVQIISWLFLAILLNILNSEKRWLKYKIFIPLLFLIWVNLHGGFLIGYLIFLFFVILRTINRQNSIKDILITLMAFLASLVNPYGLDLLGETLKQTWLLSTNPYLRFGIDEWTPIYTRFSLSLFVYFICSLLMVIKGYKRFSLFQLGVYFGLLIMTLSARRHVPLWILTSLPLTTESLYYMLKKFKLVKLQLIAPLILVAVLIFGNFVWYSKDVIHTSLMNSQTYAYPQEAVNYLVKHHIGRVFVPYTWGGYVIWKSPITKVFIDGRMPTWMETLPNGQNYWPFLQYNDILKGSINVNIVFTQYNVSTILWYRQDPTHFLDREIKSKNWIKVYEDPIAIIYIKKANL